MGEEACLDFCHAGLKRVPIHFRGFAKYSGMPCRVSPAVTGWEDCSRIRGGPRERVIELKMRRMPRETGEVGELILPRGVCSPL